MKHSIFLIHLKFEVEPAWTGGSFSCHGLSQRFHVACQSCLWCSGQTLKMFLTWIFFFFLILHPIPVKVSKNLLAKKCLKIQNLHGKYLGTQNNLVCLIYRLGDKKDRRCSKQSVRLLYSTLIPYV